MDTPQAQSDALADPTRARLFDQLVKLRRAAPTEELAELMGMHVNGVRRQLVRLAEAGLLERAQVRRGRGRPRDEWSVSPHAAPGGAPPSGYEELSRWLVRTIVASDTDLAQVESIGRQIGSELIPDGESAGELDEGFRRAFTALGFQPLVEPTEGGFSCSLGNCPYRESVREDPEVICTLHRGMTAGVLKALDPDADLLTFEPRDPDRAGCVVGVSRPERDRGAGEGSGGAAPAGTAAGSS